MLSKITVLFDRVVGRPFYKLHGWAYKRSDGRVGHTSPAGTMLLLTTTGRKSGLLRTNTLLYTERDGRFLVVGSNGGRDQPPAWLLNLTATPNVLVQAGRRKFEADAHVMDDAEKATVWPTMLEYYKGWGDYQKLTDRALKVVALTPRGASS